MSFKFDCDSVDVKWRLREVMEMRGVVSLTALMKLLNEHKLGITMSCDDMTKLARGMPKCINTVLLTALCDILDCRPRDIVCITKKAGYDEC